MSPAPERRTNRLLGYPDDARLLIINADDFGMCHANNAATVQVLRDGVATSTTLMTPCPWAPHAIQFLQQHPEIAFGVHLTLVRDFAPYRWGPLAPKESVPSLVADTGYFYRYEQIPELLAGAQLDEVEREFRAQIDSVLAANLAPTHLDWHCLADGGRQDIFDLTVSLAKDHGLAVRVHDRAYRNALQRDGLPTNDHEVLDSYHMDPTTKPARYAQLLRDLPPGLSEWAVHPSLGDTEAQALEPETWQTRRGDYDFLISSEARTLINEQGIELVDYRRLQKVWSR